MKRLSFSELKEYLEKFGRYGTIQKQYGHDSIITYRTMDGNDITLNIEKNIVIGVNLLTTGYLYVNQGSEFYLIDNNLYFSIKVG